VTAAKLHLPFAGLAADEEHDHASALQRWGLRALVVAFLAGAAWFIFGHMQTVKERTQQRKAQRIEMIQQQRPSTERPVPKPVEPEKPPPEVKRELPNPQYRDNTVEPVGPIDKDAAATRSPAETDQPPSTDQLGVIGEGGGGSDSFGLVARARGRDVTAAPSRPAVAPTDPLQFTRYAGVIRQEIQYLLNQHTGIRRLEFTVDLGLWIAGDGRIDRFELRGSTGDAAADEELRRIFASYRMTRQPPPLGFPQPVWLRIRSRMEG